VPLCDSPTTRRTGGLGFSAIGGKKQRHGSALIGAAVSGCKAPGIQTFFSTTTYAAIPYFGTLLWKAVAIALP